jgi:hypothetical protein
MLVLSESFHVFESRIACRCNWFPSRRRRRAALSIRHQLTQSIQGGESSFQEKCMDFHEIHPRVAYDMAHVCISWSVHTKKWRTTHNALCGYYKFSFRIFIWVYLNFSEYKQWDFRISHWNKFYCDFKYYFVQYFYTSGEKIFGYEYNSHVTKIRIAIALYYSSFYRKYFCNWYTFVY